ncbi:MAG: zinc finger-like domain-containing protein [Hydrogenophaga sp.]|uniref:hypothetical protein n=1 Tax=Hydrogenophaga sp. TaxID=1904254 RepID=UPI0026231CFF|nr:hypothetical protein [Hydrogenophaga sp.]MCV0439692.1 zinc finger-like domain-containing protein [Hydrogenophaga sp.]
MDENTNNDAYSQEELEKMFAPELLGKWVEPDDITPEEMRRMQDEATRIMEKSIRDMEAKQWSLGLPVEPAISGSFPLPVDPAPQEFVMPIVKGGYPKDVVDEIVKVQPLSQLPPGTCETCLGNCVRPGSGDTCGACNGTGMTDEAYQDFLKRFPAQVDAVAESMEQLSGAVEQTTAAAEGLADALTLTPEEQRVADELEIKIEDKLDEWYACRNEGFEGTEYEERTGVAIGMEEAGGNERIEEYIIGRFTGWRVDRNPAGGAFVFWPK